MASDYSDAEHSAAVDREASALAEDGEHLRAAGWQASEWLAEGVGGQDDAWHARQAEGAAKASASTEPGLSPFLRGYGAGQRQAKLGLGAWPYVIGPGTIGIVAEWVRGYRLAHGVALREGTAEHATPEALVTLEAEALQAEGDAVASMLAEGEHYGVALEGDVLAYVLAQVAKDRPTQSRDQALRDLALDAFADALTPASVRAQRGAVDPDVERASTTRVEPER